ncbi:MAG TPA: hypothetical protein VMM77_03870 [Gemmatimonadaceae bacterium]|nr:hypothetical protein [Gemmatimonadaceae bacterium]
MLDAGSSHVCGITLDDRAFCWGNQFRGKLGNGQRNGSTPQPVAVSGERAFTAVWASAGSSCALTSDGDAYCWGANDYGMLGDGEAPEPFKESTTPVRVVGGHRFASLGLVGNHACGITLDGRAYCWGWNPYGQLGDGTTAHSSSPVPVAGNHRWAVLAIGSAHNCGLTIDGAAYCWGNNDRGQFGNGGTSGAISPELIAAPGTYVAIIAGYNHTCALTDAGTAYCWGQGDYGQLGDGVFADRLRPTQVAAYE